MIKFNGKKTGIFAAGVLFGTAGIKVLTSKDAKKLYTNCTAAVLRAKSCVMKTASTIQENAEDIYAEAQQINEDREAAEEVVEDAAEETVEDFKEETETAEEGIRNSPEVILKPGQFHRKICSTSGSVLLCCLYRQQPHPEFLHKP